MGKLFVVGSFFLTTMIAGTSNAQSRPTEVHSPEAKRALRTALRFLRRNPELRGNYLRPEFSRERMAEDIPVQILDGNGGELLTRLHSDKSLLIDLGTSLRWDKDRENMLRLYTKLFALLPAEITKNLRKPGDVQKLGTRGVKINMIRMADEIRARPDTILDILGVGQLAEFLNNPIGLCPLELGFEVAGSDSEQSERCLLADYNPDGLVVNEDFALKDDLTCIKNQGSRGTCAAHAIAATVESLEMVDGGPAENLSEQHLYYQGEVEGDRRISIGDMQTYGLYTSEVLDVYDQQNLGIYYESGWNYNRSSLLTGAGIGPDLTIVYPLSCAWLFGTQLYTGEDCSDYTWQTSATVNIPGIPLPDPPPAMAGPAPHSITSHFYLPMDGGGPLTEAMLQAAVVFLANDVPLIVSMAASNFLTITLDGYVPYIAVEPMLGGHAMELVGFVPNSELPPGASAASEEGYFIAKNSWGIDRGDCGFYYLDYAYLRHHANYISGIEID